MILKIDILELQLTCPQVPVNHGDFALELNLVKLMGGQLTREGGTWKHFRCVAVRKDLGHLGRKALRICQI